MITTFSKKPIAPQKLEAFAEAVKVALSNIKNLRPVLWKTAFEALKNNTAGGLPGLTSKRIWKENFLKFVETLNTNSFEIACDMYMMNNWDNYSKVAMPYTRTQELGKTRTVWGYPADVVFVEQKYYIPLLEMQKKQQWRAALLDPDSVDRYVTETINRANSVGKYLVSVDFKGFDTSVSPSLCTVVFNVILSLFQQTYENQRDLNIISKNFTSMPIITPFRLYKGEHGVPSGSTFTNEVDSLVQIGVARSSNLVLDDCQVQGDDGLYILNDDSKYDDLIKHFADYGLTLSKEKSSFSKEYAIYLQKLYHPYFRQGNGDIPGVYSTYRALLRLCYPEKEPEFGKITKVGVSLADYNKIRAIQILENCKNHPLHSELVNFVNDRWSEGGLRVSKYVVKDFKDAIERGEVKNTQRQDNLKGWDKFKTVQVLDYIDRGIDL